MEICMGLDSNRHEKFALQPVIPTKEGSQGDAFCEAFADRIPPYISLFVGMTGTKSRKYTQVNEKLNLMWSRTHMFKQRNPFLIGCLLLATFYLPACNNEPEQQETRKKTDYIKQIPGINDTIPAAVAQKGEVLISYSDCYTCHKVDQKLVGPAFKDIAKRYPETKFISRCLPKE